MDKKFKRNINFYSRNIDYLKFKNLQSLRSKSVTLYIVLKMLKRITNVERAQTISPHFKKMRIMGIPKREERKRGAEEEVLLPGNLSVSIYLVNEKKGFSTKGKF